MSKGTLKMRFGKGFGNDLFRYCFGRILAEHHGLNYAHPSLTEFNIPEKNYDFNPKLPIVKFKAESNFVAKRKFDKDHFRFFEPEMANHNFDFSKFIFYFEDYNIYKPHIEKIRTWFPPVKKRNIDDLVFHFRLQNRAVQDTHYKNILDPKIYIRVMKENFNFNKLYIVTDAERWGHVNEQYIRSLHKKWKKNDTGFVSIDKSIKYINGLVDSFKELDPVIVHHENHKEDFDFIRSFDNVMFKNSTFSWWAALIGGAKKVGLYKPWKPNKGKNNKNLGNTDYPGWFGWSE